MRRTTSTLSQNISHPERSMAPIPRVDLASQYAVGTDSIFLDVFVGEQQQGRTTIQMNGDKKDVKNPVRNHDLGKGSALKSGTLRVVTMVTDTNPMTNRTSIRIVLRGGVKDETHDVQYQISEVGGSVIYDAVFQLV
jgi:hypothetical protein